MLDASARAVKPISDHAAAVEAGQRAGLAAAQAFTQAWAAKQPGKRPLTATPATAPAAAGSPSPEPTPSPSKRAAKKAAKLVAAAGTGQPGTAATPLLLTGPSETAQVSGATLADAAAAGAAAAAVAGLGGSPAKPGGGIKLEPLAIAAFRAKGASLERLVGGKGDSMIEVVDRMHQTLWPDTPQAELPCGWKCTAGVCRPKEGQTCAKCAKGAAPSPEVIAAAKAAMKPPLVEYLQKNYSGSPMLA